MKRPIHALLTALALAAPATALGSGEDVIRDCSLHGQLTRKYSRAELNYARNHFPADQREYSNCPAIIEAAYEQASAPKKIHRKHRHDVTPAGTGSGSGGASPSGPGGSSSPKSPSPRSSSHAASRPTRHPAPPPTFLTQGEGAALNQARATGADHVPPAAATPLRSGVGALPGSLLAVLVLLVLGGLVALAAAARRWRRDRVLPDRS